jgi:hypothetical protein
MASRPIHRACEQRSPMLSDCERHEWPANERSDPLAPLRRGGSFRGSRDATYGAIVGVALPVFGAA